MCVILVLSLLTIKVVLCQNAIGSMYFSAKSIFQKLENLFIILMCSNIKYWINKTANPNYRKHFQNSQLSIVWIVKKQRQFLLESNAVEIVPFALKTYQDCSQIFQSSLPFDYQFTAWCTWHGKWMRRWGWAPLATEWKETSPSLQGGWTTPGRIIHLDRVSPHLHRWIRETGL